MGAHLFREDINGLRALAILPVVVFHAGISTLQGGFVGVDVFYVISGYLITSLLIRETERRGRPNLREFWARRMRRIVPALALVVAVTAGLGAVVVSPLRWDELAKESAAAIFFVSNGLFAVQGSDYFNESLSRSPLLHTWSLGVEEQFYLFWPVLVLAAAILARRRRWSIRTTLRLCFGVIGILSFAASVWLTAREPVWAFYLLPTRAWEFAAAAVLATVPPGVLIRRRGVANGLALVGVTLLLISFFAVSETDPFPGSLALLPVTGTLMIIAAGDSSQPGLRPFTDRLLGSRPLQWIGSISYSWYLWHWPFVTYAIIVAGTTDTWVTVTATLAALGAADLSYRFVEDPLRSRPALVESFRRTWVTATVMVATVSVLALSLVAGHRWLLTQDPYRTLAHAYAVTPDQSCLRTSDVGEFELCEMGRLEGEQTVMLVGDSHAGMWKDAVSRAADREGLRLVVEWVPACPAAQVEVVDSVGRSNAHCPVRQQSLEQLVRLVDPDAVVVSQGSLYLDRIQDDGEPVTDRDARRAVWSNANTDLFESLQDVTPQVGVIIDNPYLDVDPIECLSTWWKDAPDCSVATAEAFTGAEQRALDEEVLDERDVGFRFSVAEAICEAGTCRAVTASGMPIYRDFGHLSRAWTLTRSDELGTFLRRLTSD